MNTDLNYRDLIFTVVALGIVVGLFGYGGYQYLGLHEQNVELTRELTLLRQSLGLTENQLSLSEAEKEKLADNLKAEQEKVSDLGEKVGEITSTVGTLEKLAKTDPELLQKYSKVYFLNEHYIPPKLADIDPAYILPAGRKLQIHGEVAPRLKDLLEEAVADGIALRVASAYRSFATQSSLKAAYKVTYGAGTANQFSADQGYSEHQLGTTVDFTTVGLAGALEGFHTTTAYAWLLDNAHKYGFILSYPAGNNYYTFEPWHWRFVGEDLARDLHRQGKHFYDLDQRVIDEYLVKIFD